LENLEKLIKGINQTNPVKREKGIKALCDFCMATPNQSGQAIPYLNKLLIDADIKISSYTAQTLVRIGKTNVSFLIQSVGPMVDFINYSFSLGGRYNGSWTTVAECIEILGEIGAVSPDVGRIAIPTLYKPLNQPLYHPQNFLPGMEKVFAGSAHALGLFANQSASYVRECVPTLFRCLVDTYTYTRLIEDARNRNGFRWWIIYAMLEIGKNNPSYVIPSLVKALTHTNMEVRRKVIEVLDTVAADPRTAVPPLVQCISSLDQELSKNASLTLGSLGQTTPEFVIPSLISLLQSQNANVLKNSLTVVNSIAKASPASVLDIKDYLIPTMNNGENEVRLNTIRVFTILAQTNISYVQETIPYLIYINMNDPSQAVKDAAVGLLNILQVDVEKYTMTIEVLRQTQELFAELQSSGKDLTKIIEKLQISKDALIELKYDLAQESANESYVMASSMLGTDVKEAPKTVKPVTAQDIPKKVEEKAEQDSLLKDYNFDFGHPL